VSGETKPKELVDAIGYGSDASVFMHACEGRGPSGPRLSLWLHVKAFDCASTVPEPNVFIPVELILGEKQILRFIGNVIVRIQV
jgi:hypothetical protein